MTRKFVASYSGGKDSILAVYRAIGEGMEPVSLLTTFRTDQKRSWFHGIPESVLGQVAHSTGIPVELIKTSGKAYAKNFEKELAEAKKLGADTCIFGDIDLEEHRVWCSERCKNAGLEPYFPLWGESREKLVYEFIDAGFSANITVVNTRFVDESFLGQRLTREAAALIAAGGADICGENGEYHTFVSDGPLFEEKIEYEFGTKVLSGGYASLPILGV